MPVTDECFDCLISRVVHSCALAAAATTLPAWAQSARRDSRSSATAPCRSPWSPANSTASPSVNSGCRTPTRESRPRAPRAVLAALRAVRPHLATFRDFVTASIIGNTFDHGVKGHEIAADFAAFFEDEFARGLSIDDCDKIERRLDRVVYITDNCGEIVLDRLLIGHLADRGARVTVAVRDGPILNDATLEDARALGLDRLVDVPDDNRGRERDRRAPRPDSPRPGRGDRSCRPRHRQGDGELRVALGVQRSSARGLSARGQVQADRGASRCRGSARR